MADEKKTFNDKKPVAAPTHTTQVEVLIGVIFILAVVAMIAERIYSSLSTGELSFFGYPLSNLSQAFKEALPTIKIITFGLSGLFTFGIIVFSQLRGTILIQEKQKIAPHSKPVSSAGELTEKNPMTEKWGEVLEHIKSEHPSDWRLAIIEADVMLNGLLDILNLPGDTMGDKMKAVEKSDFLTIDIAWEAHKVRNQIAHEGSEFLLNEREARRVIGLYEKVFEEFRMI